MTKRRLFFSLLMVILFTIDLAAASWLALPGSDSAPFESKFPASCATPNITVVYEKGQKTQPKVIEVVLTGDFTSCLGAQVLVTTYKTGNVYSYAVADITGPTSEIRLKFDKVNGDIRQKFPLIINNRLVPDGPLAPPTTSISASDIKYVFAWTWN